MWLRAALLALVSAFCCQSSILAAGINKSEYLQNHRVSQSFSGNISWYGKKFHGRRTASGEIFDMYKCTAAHRRLPFFTRVLVEDPKTGNVVLVKVNDRGPHVRQRVMDLSRGAARRLDILSRGTAFVDCLVIGNKPN